MSAPSNSAAYLSSSSDKKIYRYPYDILDETTDFLLIECIEYKPAGGGKAGDFVGSNSIQTTLKSASVKFSVVLPVPDNIATGNKVGWGDFRLSNVGGALANSAGAAMDVAADANLVEAFQAAGTTLYDNMKAVGTGGNSSLISYIKGRVSAEVVNSLTGSNISANQLIAKQTGQIVNQNLELLFAGVTLRDFGFGWNLTARDQKESVEILQFIKKLKRAQSPKRAQDTGFLQSPDVFRLSYRTGARTHDYLNAFKICALQSIGVNYTGSGVHMTYPDGAPVHQVLNLSFKELEPIYAEDYQEANF
jgi:hypothetical protein